MFGKSILCQNTVRKSATVVSDTRWASPHVPPDPHVTHVLPRSVRPRGSEDGRDRRDGRDVRYVVRDG